LNSTTAILIALTLAILLVVAFYGLSDAVIDTGGDAIDNLSDANQDEDGNTQFSSVEPHFYQKTTSVDVRRTVV